MLQASTFVSMFLLGMCLGKSVGLVRIETLKYCHQVSAAAGTTPLSSYHLKRWSLRSKERSCCLG